MISPDDSLESCAVVHLRLFGRLSNEEIAEVLKISLNTVTRKAWLYREMSKEQEDES